MQKFYPPKPLLSMRLAFQNWIFHTTMSNDRNRAYEAKTPTRNQTLFWSLLAKAMLQTIVHRIGHTTRRSVRKEYGLQGQRLDGSEKTKVRMRLRKTAVRP
jgi:hypothetical protein